MVDSNLGCGVDPVVDPALLALLLPGTTEVEVDGRVVDHVGRVTNVARGGPPSEKFSIRDSAVKRR